MDIENVGHEEDLSQEVAAQYEDLGFRNWRPKFVPGQRGIAEEEEN